MFPSLPFVTYVLKQALPISFDITHQIKIRAGFDFPNLMPMPTYLDSLSVFLPCHQKLMKGWVRKCGLELDRRGLRAWDEKHGATGTVLGPSFKHQHPRGDAEKGRERTVSRSVGGGTNLPHGDPVAAQDTIPTDIACCTHRVALASKRNVGQPPASQLPCPRKSAMLCQIRTPSSHEGIR